MATSRKQAAPKPVAFASVAAFRAWLAKHHASKTELLVACHKVHVGHRGVTYAEALDEALCFGWIDGVRRSLGPDAFSVRFTPRRAKSVWSKVNIRRVGELQAQRRMRAPGLAVFRAGDAKQKSGYSFETRRKPLTPAFAKRLRANGAAWDWYRAQAPWYRRVSEFWVMSAKQEATRERRFETLLERSAAGLPIGPLKYAKPRSASPRPR